MKNIFLTLVMSLMTILSFSQVTMNFTGKVTDTYGNPVSDQSILIYLRVGKVIVPRGTVYSNADGNISFSFDTSGTTIGIYFRTVTYLGDTLTKSVTAKILFTGDPNNYTVPTLVIPVDPTTSIQSAAQEQSKLYFSNNTLYTNSTTYIFSISGQLVKTVDTNTDLSDLKSGIYVAKCNDKTWKFLK